jgi:hypothetical protein
MLLEGQNAIIDAVVGIISRTPGLIIITIASAADRPFAPPA